MKKALVLYVAFALTLLIGINTVKGIDNGPLTDEELMDKFIIEEYGTNCYGILDDIDEENYVHFRVYENGCARYTMSINREYYQNYYSD